MGTETFLERLQRRPPLLLDGGLASELERRGASLQTRLWSAEILRTSPTLVGEVHRAYAEAGAEIATTATYQASFHTLAAVGLSPRESQELTRRSVELARASGSPFVAGSVGPYGATLEGGGEYRGGYSLSSAAYLDFHAPRVEALLAAGVDVIAAETLPVLDEAVALAALCEELDAPLWLSFQCRDARSLAGGAPVEIAAALADKAPAVVAVGVNCVAPELVSPLLERMRATTSKPLVAYPNRGERWDPEGRRFLPPEAEVDLAALVPRWVERGARIVGGCCRTTPEDTLALAAALSDFSS